MGEDFKEEIEKLGLPCIWHSQADIETNRVIRATNNRYHASEGQNLFAGFNENVCRNTVVNKHT